MYRCNVRNKPTLCLGLCYVGHWVVASTALEVDSVTLTFSSVAAKKDDLDAALDGRNRRDLGDDFDVM